MPDAATDLEPSQLAARLAALGSEPRLEIYRVLVRAGHGGVPVASIQSRVQIPASTLSHHLRRLVAVGLARQVRSGTTLHCHADLDAMRETFATFVKECCIDEQSQTPPAEGAGCCREQKQ